MVHPTSRRAGAFAGGRGAGPEATAAVQVCGQRVDARPARALRLPWLAALLVMASGCAGCADAAEAPRETPDVFAGPAIGYAEPLAAAADATSEGRLRTLSVEERAGVVRRRELVRVPVFFAEGECRELGELAIVPAGGGPPVAFQADDIRRAADGGVSRAHLWFVVDLQPGEKKRYELRRGTAGGPGLTAATTPAAVTRENGLRIPTDDGAVEFDAGGALRSVERGSLRWRFDADGAFPRVRIEYPNKPEAPGGDVVLDRETPGRQVSWSTGPLFAKVKIRIEGEQEAALEQEYRICRSTGAITVSATIFPGPRKDGVVKENELLRGRPAGSGKGETRVVRVPAGLRYDLRREHAYFVTALTTEPPAALLAIPLVIGGSNGIWKAADDGTVALQGHRGLRRGNEGEKDTLHAFWTEARLFLAPAGAEGDLWSFYRARVQPLVAVVEEPGATVDRLHTALSAIVRAMKPIGWRQEAGRALVLGDAERVVKMLGRTPQPREADEERLLRGAKASTAKITNNGERKLREHEKGRAYGGLDPYHVTYTQSAAAAVAALTEAPPMVNAINLAMTRGVWRFGGRVDRHGNPYIDVFSRNLNMQMGPVLFGLTAGKAAEQTELVRFYRDLATSPPVLAVFGRAQRPYTGAPAKSADQTDYLYQAICDLWLRTTELLGDENLGLHPLAYARYTDCIDVMADRYHGVAAKDKPDARGTPRANFYRGQAHTHRWLGWSCAPYIRLLEDPAEQGGPGLTEAIHHTLAQKGRWKNWPDLTFYILADLLVREGLAGYTPPALPALPAKLKVERGDGGGATLTWTAVPDAAGYRVYRAAKPGGPYVWLNSPYFEKPAPAVEGTEFRDAKPPENAAYVVTAVDSNGRESAWREFPDEAPGGSMTSLGRPLTVVALDSSLRSE